MIWYMSSSSRNSPRPFGDKCRSTRSRTAEAIRARAFALLPLLLACTLAQLFSLSASTEAATAATSADLTRAARSLPGASGAYVYDVTAGRRLLNRRGGVPRILASNAKLFTAAATLDRFGADERFITSLWTDGTVENGVLNGDLYLRGGGDPLFGSTDFVRKHFGSGATVEALALGASVGGLTGVSSVTGHVYGDATVFDDHRGTGTYGFRRSGEIGGQLGGLIYNKGFSSGRFQSDPTRFAAQRMRAALKRVGVAVEEGTGARAAPATARLIGYVESLPVSRVVRLMDKPSNNYLAEMLVKSLAMPVEAVSGGGSGTTGAGTGGTSSGTRGVVTTGGASEGRTANRSAEMNASGDAVGGAPAGIAADSGGAPPTGTDPVLTGGTPATTKFGAETSRAFAARLGARAALADGSGLSRADRAAPREVVDLLRGMSSHTAFTPFDDSLPIPGIDGTLASRMRHTEASKRCRAKTGTLSNVSSLSGYCTTSGGHLIAFSILNNRVWPPTARNAQDRLVKTIARLE